MPERAALIDSIRRNGAAPDQLNQFLRRQQSQAAEAARQADEPFMWAIALLARAAEAHDEGTGNHIQRVNEYSHLLARLAGQPERFQTEIRYAAQLHDVGKLAIAAPVLRKESLLDPDEREAMNNHPEFGFQILAGVPRLEMAAEIALAHHEKWDGTGYPKRLAGEAIPLSARIVAIADVYDALRSERSYKRAYGHDEAVETLLNGDDRIHPAGHFDPNLLDLFRRHSAGFAAIWRELHD